MARQDKKTYELTEAEQRDLVTLIQRGRPLPERRCFILFENKREVPAVIRGTWWEVISDSAAWQGRVFLRVRIPAG